MEITRHNYEEFFVLYIDKELNAADRAAVERFVSENPDLRAELEMFADAVLPAEDMVEFIDKSALYRQESSISDNFITTANCEEYFVMYSDNELTNKENALVEEFVYKNPAQQENFELIQQVKFQPEKHIVFPDKSSLYRSAEDHKVVPMFARMRFWKMAAAAAVVVFVCGTAWFALNNKEGNPNDPSALAANNNSSAVKPQVTVAPQVTDNAEPKMSPSTGSVPEQDVAAAETTVPAFTSTKKLSPKRTERVKPDVAEATGLDEKLYAENAVKKSAVKSNIPSPSSVKHISDGAEKVVENNTPVTPQAAATDQSLALAQNDKQIQPEQVAIGPVELKEGSAFASLANDNDEMFESSDKNKKMRGFFRKVTRVFDKATSKEPAENRKGLRIASFAIAL